mgnify:CR=1 FL=1
MDLDEEIKKLTKDRTHGSSVILRRIEDLLFDREMSDPEIRSVLSKLKEIHSSMTLVHHFVGTISGQKNQLQNTINAYFERWKEIDNKIEKRFLSLTDPVDKKIMTHSHSGMVLNLLKSLASKGFNIRVFQTLSVPGGEGRVSTGELREKGIDVLMIEDKEIPDFATKCDMAILGVDQFDDYFMVNKIHSSHIISGFSKLDRPVYALADPRKKVDRLNYANDIFEKVSLRSVQLILPSIG